MTYLEFKELGLPKGSPSPMRWSVFKDGWRDEGIDEKKIDIAAPAGIPDGTYSVYWLDGKPGFDGVQVQNGEFVLEPTVTAIDRAVRNGLIDRKGNRTTPTDKIHHVFIEGMQWDDEREMFRVQIGS